MCVHSKYRCIGCFFVIVLKRLVNGKKQHSKFFRKAQRLIDECFECVSSTPIICDPMFMFTINTTSFNNIPIFRFCCPIDSINDGMKYWQKIRGWSLETDRKFPPRKCWRQNIQYVTLNVKTTTASPQIMGVLLTHSSIHHSKHSSINGWAFLKEFRMVFFPFTSLFNTMTKKHPIQRYLECTHTIQDYVLIPIWYRIHVF